MDRGHAPALRGFARWFHQDTIVEFESYDVAADEYLGRIDRESRQQLAGALNELLSENPGRTGRGLRNAWLRLGAQAGPRPAAMRAWLERIRDTAEK
jgi:hypothetical protein